jgi:uncharacterized protein YkwD
VSGFAINSQASGPGQTAAGITLTPETESAPLSNANALLLSAAPEAASEESPLPPAAPIEAIEEPTPEPTATEPATAAAPTSTPRSQAPAPPATATPVPPPPPPAPPATNVTLAGLEQQMFNAHNAERANAGVGALELNATLVEVARQRAQDMANANYFSHTSPSGETAFTLLAKVGYGYALAGENIARNNYPDTQAVAVAMTGFMNSPGHKANLVDGRYKLVGIGSAITPDGMKYFVVVFAGS